MLSLKNIKLFPYFQRKFPWFFFLKLSKLKKKNQFLKGKRQLLIEYNSSPHFFQISQYEGFFLWSYWNILYF